LKKKTFTEKLPWWIDMLNAKKVFRLDVATRKLISADAVQLKGDYSVIYDASALINFLVATSSLNTFFAFNISIHQGNFSVKVFFFNTFCFTARIY
jgi:hypothetical protein